MFILDGKKKPRLKGAQQAPRLLREEAEESKLGRGFAVRAPVPGDAQPLAFLRHPARPFPAQRFTVHHRRHSPGGSGDSGGPHRAAGFATRKVSVISQWAPSLAAEVLELSRCREADQRISGKLESREKQRYSGKSTSLLLLWPLHIESYSARVGEG